MAKQQVMLPCSKSCWMQADRQEDRGGKQAVPVYLTVGLLIYRSVSLPLKSL